MRSRMSWEDLWPLLWEGSPETLYMVGLAALFTIFNRPAGRRVTVCLPSQRPGADAETECVAGGDYQFLADRCRLSCC